ncbi:hypothetical protein FBU59_006537, partial [Linderina macrospora]
GATDVIEEVEEVGSESESEESEESESEEEEDDDKEDAEETEGSESDAEESSEEQAVSEEEGAETEVSEEEVGEEEGEIIPLGPIPDDDDDDEEFVESADEMEQPTDDEEEEIGGYSSGSSGVTTRRRKPSRLRHSLRSADLSSQSGSSDSEPAIGVRIKRRRLVRGSATPNDSDHHHTTQEQQTKLEVPLRATNGNALSRVMHDDVGSVNGNSSDNARALKAEQERAPRGRKRKIAPSLISLTVDNPNDSEAAMSPARAASPPPIIDKPREERSYKEFFPDLAINIPLIVQFNRATPVVAPAPAPAPAVDAVGDEKDRSDVVMIDQQLKMTIDGGESSALSSVPTTPLSSHMTMSALSEVLTDEA